jgi:putative phosphoribosyl transferase
MQAYRDRYEAGRGLAKYLQKYADDPNTLVLALPRGGVPVAYEVAQALHAPLDVFLVRKLGVPGHEELAMGAIASGNVRIVNQDVVRALGIPSEIVEEVANDELRELRRQSALYRRDRPDPVIHGRTVILVDDGLATGATMRAAAEAIRVQSPAQLIVAVPVAAHSTCEEFKDLVDEVVCARTPEPFFAVGLWYEDFSQTSDREVQQLLEDAAHALAAHL